jgi:hypothetical protein
MWQLQSALDEGFWLAPLPCTHHRHFARVRAGEGTIAKYQGAWQAHSIGLLRCG